MAACGSTASTAVKAPEPAPVVDLGPPWEQLNDDHWEAIYANNHACGLATELMLDMMEWDSIAVDGPEEVSPGRYVDLVQSVTELVGVLQYREGEPRVVEMGMLMLEGMEMVFIDYEVLRAFHTGAASPEDEEALSLATGKYFCVYM